MGRNRKCSINHTLNNDNPGKGFYFDINHGDIERTDVNRYYICFNPAWPGLGCDSVVGGGCGNLRSH